MLVLCRLRPCQWLPMLSNALELAGMTCLTAAAYEYSGRALAFLVLAGCLFVLGLAVDGVKLAPRAWLLRRWMALRTRWAKRRAGLTSPM